MGRWRLGSNGQVSAISYPGLPKCTPVNSLVTLKPAHVQQSSHHHFNWYIFLKKSSIVKETWLKSGRKKAHKIDYIYIQKSRMWKINHCHDMVETTLQNTYGMYSERLRKHWEIFEVLRIWLGARRKCWLWEKKYKALDSEKLVGIKMSCFSAFCYFVN